MGRTRSVLPYVLEGVVAKLVIFFIFCKEFGKFLLTLQVEKEEEYE